MRRQRQHPRPSAVWFWRNWRRSTLALAARTRLSLRNNWIKVRNVEECCGNYGAAGC